MRRELRNRFALAVMALTVLALSLVPAGFARGATWTGIQLPEAAKAPLFGISCPTTSLCVAVGGGNTITSSANPTGGPGAWSVAFVGAGPVPPNQRQVRGVSCPSPQLCVAVTFEGLVYTSTNPTGGAGAWSGADLAGSGPNTHLYGVSCPSPSFCAAAAGGGKIVTSTNPAGGPTAWSTTQLEQPVELRGISCVSPSLCVAVGDDGQVIRPEPTDDGVVFVSTSPLGGIWQQAQAPGGQGSLFGVSCPSPGLCVSGNMLGNLVISTDPANASVPWATTDGGGTVQITAADCPSPTHCVVVDNNGDVLTSTDPTGGASAWTFANVAPYPATDSTAFAAGNHMFGVSCATTSFCAIVANHGQVFTSEDPFAAPRPVAEGKGKRSKGPKRPRVRIAASPDPETQFDGRKYPARFRFFAVKRVQVRGFVCKIDRRPMKRCRSPRAYRVGVGKHVFRVRAIGRTGLRGPQAVVRFKTCRPQPLPLCLKRLPPPRDPSGFESRREEGGS